MKKLLCAAVIAALGTVYAATPAKNPWGSFNKGSWVKLKSTTEMSVAGHKNVINTDTKMTLLDKTADKAVLETEVTAMGQTTKSKIDIPFNAKDTGAKANVTPKTGSETITVAGKSFACVTAEIVTETNGVKANTKSWTSDKVPGGLVKSETTTTGQVPTKTVMELVDFKAL